MSDTSDAGKKKGFEPSTYYKDTPKSGVPAADLLSSARLHMLKKFPFFGKLSMNMVLVETNDVQTTAVDPKGRMYYNPKWVNAFTMEDAVFEFAHETMHLCQRLFTRRANRHPQVFNLAGDYCADAQLIECGIPQSFASKLMVGEEQIKLVNELKLIERVYDHLLQDIKQNTDCPACKQAIEELQKAQAKEDAADKKEQGKGQGEGDGAPQDGSGDGDGHEHGEGEGCGGNKPSPKHTCGGIRKCCAMTTADIDKSQPADVQKMIQNVIAAKMYAEGKGNMPGILGAQIDELTKSRVRWQDYLKTAANKVFSRGRYTYKRPNRRGPAIGVRIPSQQPESRTAVIAVDTSGSMGLDAIKQCISESAAIIKASGCEKLWLILHDYPVYYSGYVGEADLTKLQISCGGTSHVPVFEIINRTHDNKDLNLPSNEHCELAIMFTDLGTCFPAEAPAYPVIWGVPDPSGPGMSADVPFGKKVPVEMDNGA